MPSEVRIEEVEPQAESLYYLKRVEKSSAELTSFLHTRLEQKDISERYQQQFGVYVNKNAIEHIPNFAKLSITELLKLAKEFGLLVAIYGGGIGIGINSTDSSMPKGIGEARVTIPDQSQSDSSLAARFLAEKDKNVPIEHAAAFLAKDFDVVIVLEPPEELDAQGQTIKKRTILSSLAADALSRTVVMEQLHEQHLTPEIYDWSDSGFKETQICIAAYKAIELSLRLAKFLHIIEKYDDINDKNINDILLRVEHVRFKPLPEDLKKEYRHEETMPVFGSGLEAYHYLQLHTDVDIIIAASPDDRESLAFAGPLRKSDTNPILQKVKAGLFAGINEGVGVLGQIDRSPIVDALYSDTLTIPEELRGPVEYIAHLFGADKNPALSKIVTLVMTGQYLPSNFSLLLSRLAEIGRAKKFSVGEDEESEHTQKVMERIMPGLRGDGMIAFLNDRGIMATVDATRSKVTEYLNTIFPQKVIHITSNPDVPHVDDAGNIVYEKTSHASIKEPKTIDYIRAFIAMAKLDVLPHLRESVDVSQYTDLALVSRYAITSPNQNGKVDAAGSAMHDPMPIDTEVLFRLKDIENLTKEERAHLVRVLKPFDGQVAAFIQNFEHTDVIKLIKNATQTTLKKEGVLPLLQEVFKEGPQVLVKTAMTFILMKFVIEYIDKSLHEWKLHNSKTPYLLPI